MEAKNIIKINILQGYNCIIEKGSLSHLCDYFSFDNKKVLIIADSNTKIYISSLNINNAYTYIIASGEKSKSLGTYLSIIEYLTNNNFSKTDILIALGGGVVGDLTGFIASTYKRGMQYINVPTSTIAMIDASIGGKNALNCNHIKNIIGTFYQPALVLIDSNTLESLPERHYNSGLIEALKMGLILNKDIIDLFNDFKGNIQEIIYLSVLAKKKIIEVDCYDNNVRMCLNFGHTIGHAIEAYEYNNSNPMYHGESIACGMRYFIKNAQLLQKIDKILDNLHINYHIDFNIDQLYENIKNDKKIRDGKINIIIVYQAGKYEIKRMNVEDIQKYL